MKLSQPFSAQDIDQFFFQYLADIGLKTPEEVENFLFPQLSQLPDPFTMNQMEQAADKVSDWVINKRPFLIWGDYDVDGITGSAILFSFLKQLKNEVECHIPDRVTEGYGINTKRLGEFSLSYKEKRPLLITVDCGMSNYQEIEFAKEIGFEVIVTDHHEPGDLVPRDCLVINGKKHDCTFDTHQLSGVGTVFFLLVAVRKKLMEKNHFSPQEAIPNLKQFLALTALGTVADMMPITQTNRILIKAGFEVLSPPDKKMTGLHALLAALDLEKGVQSVDEIAFKIAPAINAAGRIGNPKKAFALLTTDDTEEAEKLAHELISLNERRKSIAKGDYDTAIGQISSYQAEQDKCVVIFGKFHQGLTGIIASKLVETFGLPAIVFSEIEAEDTETVLKGSCRSIDGLHILQLVQYAEKFTVKYGGHQGAAGVTMKKKNFEAFRLMIIDAIQSGIGRVAQKTKLKPYEISLDQAFSGNFLYGLRLLEPTGEGAPKPEFMDTDAKVVHCKQIGREKEHLQVVFRGFQKNHRGVGFYQGHLLDQVHQSEKFIVIYTPYLNKFNKAESWQVMVNSISHNDK